MQVEVGKKDPEIKEFIKANLHDATATHSTSLRRAYDMTLSTRVFETRTVVGSELFSLLTCPHTSIFTLPSVFSSLEMCSIKISETIRS